MHPQHTRRKFLPADSAQFALSQLPASLLAYADSGGEQLVPFLDEQPTNPKRPMLKWEDLRDWITPTDQFFAVGHYHTPKVDAASWQLKVEGLVDKPIELSLDQIKSRPKRELVATLECSGNGASQLHGRDRQRPLGRHFTGRPSQRVRRAPASRRGGILGDDTGKEKIRKSDRAEFRPHPLNGRCDARQHPARLGMNGQPLAAGHRAPLRLIVPGWYGIAWVKWLSRIELRDRRLMNRFMARDYVTIRGEKHGDQTEWKETSVGPMNVKSLLGRVTRRPDGSLHITGAAWGQDAIKSVELKIDDGPWKPVQLDEQDHAPHAWTFWSYDWKSPPPGEHTLVCCATDVAGHMQPSADDDSIKLKKTYWEANQQYPRRIKL